MKEDLITPFGKLQIHLLNTLAITEGILEIDNRYFTFYMRTDVDGKSLPLSVCSVRDDRYGFRLQDLQIFYGQSPLEYFYDKVVSEGIITSIRDYVVSHKDVMIGMRRDQLQEDITKYEAELETLKQRMEKVQTYLTEFKSDLESLSRTGPANENRT